MIPAKNPTNFSRGSIKVVDLFVLSVLSVFLVLPVVVANPDFYAEGGTIYCYNANVGDTGVVGGVEYTAVNNSMLYDMVFPDEDYTVICTSHVTNMYGLFDNSISNINFNQPIGHWDTSNVTSMREMFRGDRTFNQDIGGWNTSKVTNMFGMFSQTDFDQDISGWDTSNVVHMTIMFSSNRYFNQPIGGWDTSNVVHMGGMFRGAESFDQDISDWDVSNVGVFHYGSHGFFSRTHMSSGFVGFSTANYDALLEKWSELDLESNPNLQFAGFHAGDSMYSLSHEVYRQKIIDDFGWLIIDGGMDPSSYTPGCTDSSADNYDSLADFDDGSCYWDSHFYEEDGTIFCPTAQSGWVGGVGGVNYTAVNDTVLKGMNPGSDDYTVICTSLVIDISELFRDTSFNQSISHWDVSGVTNMGAMFKNSYFNQDISSWDVSNVESMREMFRQTPFNQDLSGWDTKLVKDMSLMFYFAGNFNQPISSWNVSSVTDMLGVFSNALTFNQDLSSWDVSNVTRMNNMLLNTAFSISNYDSLLNAWANLDLKENVRLDVTSKYTSDSSTARQFIIDTYNWEINDEGIEGTSSGGGGGGGGGLPPADDEEDEDEFDREEDVTAGFELSTRHFLLGGALLAWVYVFYANYQNDQMRRRKTSRRLRR